MVRRRADGKALSRGRWKARIHRIFVLIGRLFRLAEILVTLRSLSAVWEIVAIVVSLALSVIVGIAAFLWNAPLWLVIPLALLTLIFCGTLVPVIVDFVDWWRERRQPKDLLSKPQTPSMSSDAIHELHLLRSRVGEIHEAAMSHGGKLSAGLLDEVLEGFAEILVAAGRFAYLPKLQQSLRDVASYDRIVFDNRQRTHTFSSADEERATRQEAETAFRALMQDFDAVLAADTKPDDLAGGFSSIRVEIDDTWTKTKLCYRQKDLPGGGAHIAMALIISFKVVNDADVRRQIRVPREMDAVAINPDGERLHIDWQECKLSVEGEERSEPVTLEFGESPPMELYFEDRFTDRPRRWVRSVCEFEVRFRFAGSEDVVELVPVTQVGLHGLPIEIFKGFAPPNLPGAPPAEHEAVQAVQTRRSERIASWRAMLAEVEGKGGNALSKLRQHEKFYSFTPFLSEEVRRKLDTMDMRVQISDVMQRSIGQSSALLRLVEDEINRLAREWGID